MLLVYLPLMKILGYSLDGWVMFLLTTYLVLVLRKRWRIFQNWDLEKTAFVMCVNLRKEPSPLSNLLRISWHLIN